MKSELESVNGHQPTGTEIQVCSMLMPEIVHHKLIICLAVQINLAKREQRIKEYKWALNNFERSLTLCLSVQEEAG